MAEKKQGQKLYTKQQFLSSKKYTAGHKDLLSVLLEDKKSYTHEQVKNIAEKFLKKEVE
ncbi:hypothetical protein [Oxobacter pfennigii]|uniref:hypothetical protein n=1 Tax=Oxobacter pfennigii TaxID=36849 RepID=UPI003BFA684A